MTARVPVPLSNWMKLKLVWLAFFKPAEFERIEAKDNTTLETRPKADPSRVQMVRTSYVQSLVLVLSAVIVGWLVALVGQRVCSQTRVWPTGFGIIGTALLLWATVAVRGWEVASFSTVTLGERLNIWIFRFLYWIGTACLIAALFWG